ncbi:MAG: hypothetical protein AMJ46_12540 [Latescibacteria bacterium DG_63]|nr:MAG: hypothetical protein AMJ46_12540 [Latescibacteria bacterium DG_63]
MMVSRAMVRNGRRGRHRKTTAAMRTVALWLSRNGVRYAKTDVSGASWTDERNRGAPPILILTPPPVKPDIPGVALYVWPGGYAQITDSQDRWIKHFDQRRWCVLLAHGVDEAIDMLGRLGYQCKEDQ